MKQLKLASGEMVNITKFDIDGDNFGWDVWYFDDHEIMYNDLLFNDDLDDVKKLNKLIEEFTSKISDDERVKFSIRKEV